MARGSGGSRREPLNVVLMAAALAAAACTGAGLGLLWQRLFSSDPPAATHAGASDLTTGD